MNEQDVGKLHPRWEAICGIKDDLFRLLIASTQDNYILAGLAKGFPEFFLDQPSQLRVPASALRAVARKQSLADGYHGKDLDFDTELCWHGVIGKFNIPLVYRYICDEGDDPVPVELLEQLVGQKLAAGLSVEYRGIRCLVVHIDQYVGELHEVITRVSDLDILYLVPADCIDLTA